MRKIVFFHGEYCPPCRFAEKNIIPILEKVGTVESINLNEQPITARRLHIQQIPTYFFEEDGELAFRKTGKLDVEKAVRWLKGGDFE